MLLCFIFDTPTPHTSFDIQYLELDYILYCNQEKRCLPLTSRYFIVRTAVLTTSDVVYPSGSRLQ